MDAVHSVRNAVKALKRKAILQWKLRSSGIRNIRENKNYFESLELDENDVGYPCATNEFLDLVRPVIKSGKHLDVGIGGAPILPLLKRVINDTAIHGIDISKPYLGMARKRGAVSVQGASQILPFKDGSFDSATAINVLPYINEPSRTIAEMSRVLKNNGKILVNFVDDERSKHSFARERMQRIMHKNGLSIDEMKTLSLPKVNTTFIYATKKQKRAMPVTASA